MDTTPEESVGGLAATQAYEEAGIGRRPLLRRVARCVGAFRSWVASIRVVRSGEGIKLIETNATRLGGRIPVNTSGGLLPQGTSCGCDRSARKSSN